MPVDLYAHSLTVILANQHAGGAYVACPRFAPYRFAWFRDGAYIAHAMDLAGQHESARRFHDFVGRTVLHYEQKLQRSIAAARQGIAPAGNECFHNRYTLDGLEARDEWGHHQLDGLGTWLWALAQHVRLSGHAPLPEAWRRAAGAAAAYLQAVWRYPCYDCWEENGDRIHTYTLAAVYGGLQAAAALLGAGDVLATAATVRAFVLQCLVHDGRLVKFAGSEESDASLLGAVLPYGLLPVDDPLARRTVQRVEEDLGGVHGGLHRYRRDTYYGGGAWVLLTAWLGWYYARAGELERAQALGRWVEAQATAEGDLPEQAPVDLNEPSYYPLWLEKWGPIASPLLWSHAQYIILRRACEAAGRGVLS